jgi:hypothetical protein
MKNPTATQSFIFSFEIEMRSQITQHNHHVLATLLKCNRSNLSLYFFGIWRVGEATRQTRRESFSINLGVRKKRTNFTCQNGRWFSVYAYKSFIHSLTGIFGKEWVKWVRLEWALKELEEKVKSFSRDLNLRIINCKSWCDVYFIYVYICHDSSRRCENIFLGFQFHHDPFSFGW